MVIRESEFIIAGEPEIFVTLWVVNVGKAIKTHRDLEFVGESRCAMPKAKQLTAKFIKIFHTS